jgi:hypothetical protein
MGDLDVLFAVLGDLLVEELGWVDFSTLGLKILLLGLIIVCFGFLGGQRTESSVALWPEAAGTCV